MSEEAQETKAPESRRRGTGFPSMPLQDAVEAITTAGQRGRDHSHNAFAGYLGHQSSNSGPYRAKLAAMRDWGLIARSNDRVVLTELAVAFVHSAPEQLSQQKELIQAFTNCTIFADLYRDSPMDIALPRTRLRSIATLNLGVTADSADRFVESFIDSAQVAGLATLDGEFVKLLPVPSGDTSDGSGETPADDTDQEKPNPPTVKRPATAGSASDAPIAIQQLWPTANGGEISFVVRSRSALPASAFAAIAAVVESASKLAEDLGFTTVAAGEESVQ